HRCHERIANANRSPGGRPLRRRRENGVDLRPATAARDHPPGNNGRSPAPPASPMILAWEQRLAQTARSEQVFARQPAGVVGGKKHRDRSDIIRPTAATERGLRDLTLDEVAADKAPGARTLGFYESRIDRVDP